MAEHQISAADAKQSILACAAYLAENIKSSDGHSEALKEIIPRYLNKNAVDTAAEFADSVDDPFVRDRLLLLVAEKCAAIDDDEYAAQLIEAIEDFGTKAQANERLALQKSANGAFEKALAIAETLNHADYVFGDIAAHQAANGDANAANETLARIEFPNAKVVALQNIAHQYLEKGDAARAAELLEKAAQAANEIEFTEEKVRALIDIGEHFIEAGENGRAIENFDRAKTAAETLENQHRDLFLSGIALGFLKAGSVELADRALDAVADNVQIASTLLGYSRHFGAKNEPDEAAETLEEAYAILKSQKDREVRDSRCRYDLWATIAVEFARLEKGERAVEIAQEILDETAQTAALTQIAQLSALQNKDVLARQSVNAIADDARKMFALIGISDAKIKAGKTDEALNFLREAETLSETVPQLASRSAALNDLAARFHNLGDAAKERELLQENLELIATIRDESRRAVTLAQLSDFYERPNYELNDHERAVLETLVGK